MNIGELKVQWEDELFHISLHDILTISGVEILFIGNFFLPDLSNTSKNLCLQLKARASIFYFIYPVEHNITLNNHDVVSLLNVCI